MDPSEADPPRRSAAHRMTVFKSYSHPTPRQIWIAALLAALCAVELSAQRRGRRGAPMRQEQEKEELPPPVPLGEAATRAVAARYFESKHWVQKSVVLLSLNRYWHPSGTAMILDAIHSKDRRLRSYGVETLLRTQAELLPSVVSSELIQELITKQLQLKNAHYRSRVLGVLGRIVPGAGATTKSQWSSWWSKSRDTWQPKPWIAPPKPEANGGDPRRTVVQSFVERAFDLYHSGLDVAICIDSTGSMQPTIDTARDAIGEMLAILDGVSPKLRMGLTHYKDFGDMREGAKLLMPLSKNVKTVRTKLGKLVAMGGGDPPERVANGLEFALSRKMRWKKDTNKLVIIIGDAPPQDLDKAVALAKNAFENPGTKSKTVLTGPRKKSKIKPILTSAIAVGSGPSAAFREIAKAGGGAFAQIDLVMPRGGVPRGRGAGGKFNAKNGDATERIVEHILTLSFGARFKREMRAFVKIFYAYRRARFFK